ncbi:ABC transporter substrate-binding protein [Hyphomicrobiales bacterium]|nr:ABC transporter substrate-binding protein [Hyphomicrobiales bacterium]CAH1691800.1 putative Extracellular solute-binding protein family 5 [Hyphomicrobiales bacterium]
MAMLRKMGKAVLASALALAMGGAALAQNNTPVRGGTLTGSLILTLKSLDPIFGDADTIDRFVFNQIYDPLIRMTDDGKIVPVLATAYRFSEDGRQIFLTLREGVTFHDGTPFNAEAVVFNLNRLRTTKEPTTRAGDVAHIADVVALSDNEVRIDLKQPSGSALSGLAMEGTLMVSPAAVKKFGAEYGRNPVGTGPFRFVEWVGQERVVLKANPDYWQKTEKGEKLPYLDGVVIRSIPNYATAILELESGGTQLMQGINPQDFDRIAANPNLKLVESPQVTSQMLVFNTQRAPFSDQRVRQAVALSIDRATLAKAIAGKYGAVYATMMPPSDWVYDASLPGWGYDPERARKLLAEAGFPNGLDLNLAIIQREPDATTGQIIQQMMKASGINLKLSIVERQSWIERVVNQKNFDLGMMIGYFPRPDPHESWGRYFSRDGGNNWSNHTDAKLYDMIDAAQLETNVDKRKTMYSDIAKRVLDQSFMVFLYARPALQAKANAVQGVEQDVGGAWVLTNAYLK